MSLSPIENIRKGSPGERAGISIGERVISINSHLIQDVLDYKYYSYDKILTLELENKTDGTRQITLHKQEGEDLGLDFQTYLMDKPRSCGNKCIFCFVDQMPQGMRDTLYFKDDDARLSFLTGNYITLTNLSPRERKRIIDLKISPINISVHTTNPDLRETLLKHPKAGECLSVMNEFAQGGITMNCQIVACPSYNDNGELSRTLDDLSTLYPQVNSVSVVPVGLTKYRENLPQLSPYNRETAGAVIDIVEQFAREHYAKQGTSLVWCSDEFYLKGERPLPEEDYFEEFTQLENGVGMLRMFQCEFQRGLALMEGNELKGSDFSIATGTAAAPLLIECVNSAIEKSKKEGFSIKGAVYAIENDFFGHTVNVAGLITGQDLIAQLKNKDLGTRLLIPESMLRHGETVFLDDITLSQVETTLNTTIIPIPQDGYDLVDAIYEVFQPKTRTITPDKVPMTEEAFAYRPFKS